MTKKWRDIHRLLARGVHKGLQRQALHRFHEDHRGHRAHSAYRHCRVNTHKGTATDILPPLFHPFTFPHPLLMGLFDRRFQRCNAQAKTFRCYRTETNNQLFSPSSTHTSTAGARVLPRTKQNHAVVKQEM